MICTGAPCNLSGLVTGEDPARIRLHSAFCGAQRKIRVKFKLTHSGSPCRGTGAHQNPHANSATPRSSRRGVGQGNTRWTALPARRDHLTEDRTLQLSDSPAILVFIVRRLPIIVRRLRAAVSAAARFANSTTPRSSRRGRDKIILGGRPCQLVVNIHRGLGLFN